MEDACLSGLLGTLENVKTSLHGNDAVTKEVVAQVRFALFSASSHEMVVQAHLEQFAFKLFTYADGREKNGDVDNKVVQSFYTAGEPLVLLGVSRPIKVGIVEATVFFFRPRSRCSDSLR